MAWINAKPAEMIDLDRVLEELEQIDPRKCRMVELRFFLGFTAEETAELLNISKATVDRELRFREGLAQRSSPISLRNDTTPPGFAPTRRDEMMKDADNWQLLQDLFHLGEVTPEADRERVLAEKCPSVELRRRAHEAFLTSPTSKTPYRRRRATPGRNHFCPAKSAPTTLIRHLGTGGIGAVYLVERMAGGALQRSALKVLAPHSAGPSFIERFHREQHILASLDHPNITRMLDAGLSDRGQPYLVMEYVDGVHLDMFCDTHKLGIPGAAAFVSARLRCGCLCAPQPDCAS